MKLTVNGVSYHIDVRFVKGVNRTYSRSLGGYIFTCVLLGHSFQGNKHELGKHLKRDHKDIFVPEVEV